MKVERLVTRSLRLLQVIDPKQSVKASDMETGIEVLNDLCARIEADQVALGWSAVANPSDELPLAAEMMRPIAYLLAIDLAPEWGVTPLPEVQRGALEGMQALERDNAVATPIQPILSVPTPSYKSGRTINGESWYVG